MLYWDEVLFPSMLATIRGERYLLLSDNQIYDELVELAKRAITAFKFPKQSLEYDKTEDTTDNFGYKYYFINDNIGNAEIQVLVAWMKVFWIDNLILNADNFNNLYHDSNISAYSPGNLMSNYIKTQNSYKADAKALEQNYYRVDIDGSPAITGTIDDV